MPVSLGRVSRTALISVLALLCTVRAQDAPPQHNQLLGVLWMQRAAESKASCLQAFGAARAQLPRLLRDTSITACLEQGADNFAALPPAIVTDVDETILDNSALNARLILDPKLEFKKAWPAWVKEEQATPIPGALGFLTFAHQMGVRVIYITNRETDEEAATRANLKRLGFPLSDDEKEDLVLTAGEIGDKSARRRDVAKRYRIVMLLGDNLADFVPGVEPRKENLPQGKAIECRMVEAARSTIVEDFADYWGTRWMMLPNPVYGSWEKVLAGQAKENDLRNELRTQMRPQAADAASPVEK